VQVPPGASDVPQDVVVKVNNPAPFPIPATVSPVIVTGVGALAAVPVFVTVTTLVTGVRPAGIVKVRVRAPPTVASVALVAAVKANVIGKGHGSAVARYGRRSEAHGIGARGGDRQRRSAAASREAC